MNRRVFLSAMPGGQPVPTLYEIRYPPRCSKGLGTPPGAPVVPCTGGPSTSPGLVLAWAGC